MKTKLQKVDPQKRNKFNSPWKTMGISLSTEQFGILKDYANKTNQSVSKILMDSVDWDKLKEELSE